MALFAVIKSVLERFKANKSARNVIWNMLGGLWAGVLSVLATPWLVARLGFEGYGIIGLWLMMQVMLGLLDMGMGATLVREFADSRSDLERLEYRSDLLRTLEVVYGGTALILCLVLGGFANVIAEHWLKVPASLGEALPQAIRLMAVTLALQFVCILYVNGMAGIQEHGRMNVVQMLGNALRYGGGVAIVFWRADLVTFFAAQVLVATFQVYALRVILWKSVSIDNFRPPLVKFQLVRRLGRFSMGMAATAVFSALLCNVDRIVVSKMLPASDLGKYALAFTATGILQMAIQPFYRSFFPRYAELISLENNKLLVVEYFRSCRFLAIIIIALGAVAWFFAPWLLLAWLNSCDHVVLQIFRWLLFGITCAGLMWLPAAFQQAKGWPGLHVGMILGALGVGIPIMVWAIHRFGVVGGVVVWVLHGVIGLTLELWLMHRRLLKGCLGVWYLQVVLIPVGIILPLVATSSWLMPKDLGRMGILMWVGVTGVVVLLIAMLSIGFSRVRLVPSVLDLKEG